MFAEIAKQWIGVKYIHRGFTRKGCDCSGFIVGIIKEMGFLKRFTMPIYSIDWNLHKPSTNYLVEYLKRFCVKTEGIPQIGDLVVFKFGKHISHIGILVADKTFIHCYQGVGVKYGTLNPGQWEKRVDSFWRIDIEKLKCSC